MCLGEEQTYLTDRQKPGDQEAGFLFLGYDGTQNLTALTKMCNWHIEPLDIMKFLIYLFTYTLDIYMIEDFITVLFPYITQN